MIQEVLSSFQLLRLPVDHVTVGSGVVCQNAYEKHKTVVAAQGCKIIAKDLEKSLAGLPMFIAHQHDEVEIYKVRCCTSVPRPATMLFHFLLYCYRFYVT